MKKIVIAFGIVICLLLSVIIFLHLRDNKQAELNSYRAQLVLLQSQIKRNINYMGIEEMNEYYNFLTVEYPKKEKILLEKIKELKDSVWFLE